MGIIDKFKKSVKSAASKGQDAVDKKPAGKVVAKSKKEDKKSSDGAKLVASKPVKSESGVRKSKEVVAKAQKTFDLSYRALIRPLITEKSTELSNQGKYVFEVGRQVNKIEVARAVESLYDVEVEKVNVIVVRGKRIGFRGRQGKRKNFKKAIVSLKKGQKIDVFEGV